MSHSHSKRIVATQVNGHTFTVSDRYDFSNSKILGRGTYGVVATALDTHSNRTIAIKRIRPFANDDWDARHTLREIRLLRVLGPHPNIISLYNLSSHEEKAELYMMMELMDCDLHRVIQSKQVLTPKHIRCFLKQILEGIRAMHEVGVFHRDLKPGNILVSKDCQVRITDFGLARFMDEATRQGTNKLNPMTEYVVTRWYRAPELLLSPGGTYDEAIDLWSIGCIFAELLRRRPLFPGKSHAHQVQLIFELLGYDPENLGFTVTVEAARYLDKRSMSFSNNATTLRQAVGAETPDDAIDLLEQLLTVNPNYRCSAQIALQGKFLRGADLLCDYSRNYIHRPSLEDFDFEQEKYSLEELKEMILDEMRYYQRRSSNAGSSNATSPAHPSSSSQQSNTASWALEGDENIRGGGSREGNLSREGTVGRDHRGNSQQMMSASSYIDDAGYEAPSQMNTSTRSSTLGAKRSMESMLAESTGVISGNNSVSSKSHGFRGTAVGNIIASARNMNASSPTPRTAITPSKQQIAATLQRESKARYRQNPGSLGPLGDQSATARFPARVPPLVGNASNKSLSESLSASMGVFSNLQAYQSLSARGQALDNSASGASGGQNERKAFTAPSFHFPVPFSSTSTTPLATVGNSTIFGSSAANYSTSSGAGVAMDIQEQSRDPTRVSLESKPLTKTASWRHGSQNNRSLRR
jgi:serine/threonine protein kinase